MAYVVEVESSSSRLPSASQLNPLVKCTMMEDELFTPHENNNSCLNQNYRVHCVDRRKMKNKVGAMTIGFNCSTLLFIVSLVIVMGITTTAAKSVDNDNEFLFDESDINALQEKEFSMNNVVSPMSSPIAKSHDHEKKKAKKHDNVVSSHRSNNNNASTHHKHNSNRKSESSSSKAATVINLSSKKQQLTEHHHRREDTGVQSHRQQQQKKLKLLEKNYKHQTPKKEDDKRRIWRLEESDDIDDEDYVNDEASGSGMPPTETDDNFTTTTSADVIYYRMIINFTNIAYDLSLSSRSHARFQNLSKELVELISPLYESIPGDQVITVVKFTPANPGTLVTTDLGTLDYYDEAELKDTMVKQLQKRSIGSYETSSEGFTFYKVGVLPKPSETPPCADNEFQW